MSTDLTSSLGGSGFLHLVEAATALTQLVGPSNFPRHVAPLLSYNSSTEATQVAVASPVPQTAEGTVQHARRITREVSDDDETLATCSMLLRANHMKALRDAKAPQLPPSTVPGQSFHAHPTTICPPMNRVTDNSSSQTTSFPQQIRTNSRISKSEKEMFPMRLHALLADPTVRDVISWLPHGRSFVVLRPDVFATRVLPRYFAPEGSNSPNANQKSGNSITSSQGVHKYPSFTRKLNRWGFRQISRGVDAGAFCHDLFRREDPEACRAMVCQKSRKSTKGNNSKFDDMESVSSASTRQSCVSSGDKRTFSSTVTVSTAGVSAASCERSEVNKKSLPFKKRRSGPHQMIDAVPNMVGTQQRTVSQASSVCYPGDAKVRSSASVAESDVTASNMSDNGSICSSNVQKTAASKSPVVGNNGPAPVALTAEAAAKEALMRHFHQQHRVFALQSLMENSRMAMEAAGIKNIAPTPMPPTSGQSVMQSLPKAFSREESRNPLGATTNTAVVAPTVSLPEPRVAPIAQSPSAEAAKSALYKAYIQALSSS